MQLARASAFLLVDGIKGRSALTTSIPTLRHRHLPRAVQSTSSMIPTHTIGNFKARPLQDDELRQYAPSIFANRPMLGLSSRYIFVPTTEIVGGLREKNWLPVSAEQQRVRISERIGFQKHLIRFRRAEQMQTLDDWNAELVLTNSHDAACAYVLRVGVYRRLCSNGLVASGDSFEAIRFRHSGFQVDEVVRASFRILDYVPKMGALIERFRGQILTPTAARTFVRSALLLRFVDLDSAPIAPETLLEARRGEDQADDLWTVLNRTQEHLVRGGLQDSRRDRRGRLRRLRSLRGIDSKVVLNQALWRLAETTLAASN